MELIKTILDEFFSFQAYVMLPFFIFVIAMLVRMNVSKAFISSLKMGVGFAGILIVFAFFVDNIKPAVQAIVLIRGLDFPVLDVGWPPLAAITWSSSLAPVSIPLIIALNVLMIATNTSKTIYIDIWNYWHLALAGAFILVTSQSLILGLIAISLITMLSTDTGITVGEGQMITAFTDGGNHARFFLIHLFKGNLIALTIIPLVSVMIYLSYRKARSMSDH